MAANERFKFESKWKFHEQLLLLLLFNLNMFASFIRPYAYIKVISLWIWRPFFPAHLSFDTDEAPKYRAKKQQTKP